MALEKESGVGMRLVATTALMLFFVFPRAAHAESSALILQGIGGDARHTAKFTKWTDDTRKVLVDKFGFLPDRVIVVADKETTKENIKKAFDTVKGQVKPIDSFFLFFIGHGDPWEIPGTAPPVDITTIGQSQGGGRSSRGSGGPAPAGRGAPAPGGRGGSRGGRGGGGPQTPLGLMDYKFNIQGPDYTGTEYMEMLPAAARVAIINTTNSSGASLEIMAKKNHVLITATRSASEVNDTIFYDHFLAGLQDAASDEDKDKKVSLWEAFKFASEGVERFYKEQGRLATEHPMLSDNGMEAVNSAVTNLPVLARSTVFNVDRPATAGDVRMQTLLNERTEIELKIAALQLDERNLEKSEYEKRFQTLLLELARKNAEIKQLQEKK
jgi:hypothetical protein